MPHVNKQLRILVYETVVTILLSTCLCRLLNKKTTWMRWCDCRQHGGLAELNGRLVESLQLYHSLMQELPSYSQPAVHNMPTHMSLSQVNTPFSVDNRLVTVTTALSLPLLLTVSSSL